jgi:hypothetical protein
MGQRPYLRELTQLSKPLLAAVMTGALAAIVWAVVVALDQVWEVDVDVATPVLGALMLGVVVSAGIELRRNRSKWVRGLGTLLIAGVVAAVLFVALVIWYATALCGEGGCT